MSKTFINKFWKVNDPTLSKPGPVVFVEARTKKEAHSIALKLPRISCLLKQRDLTSINMDKLLEYVSDSKCSALREVYVYMYRHEHPIQMLCR